MPSKVGPSIALVLAVVPRDQRYRDDRRRSCRPLHALHWFACSFVMYSVRLSLASVQWRSGH